MRLYILRGFGVFGDASEETLPARLSIVSGDAVNEVCLDDVSLTVRDKMADLPANLKDGVHNLKVNGRACEALVVKHGRVRPAGEDFRRLLPVLSHLCALERRLCALEGRAKEKEIDWLK